MADPGVHRDLPCLAGTLYLSPAGYRPAGKHGLGPLRFGAVVVERGDDAAGLSGPAPAGGDADQPTGAGRANAGPGVQHHGVLYYQHQLAGVLGRDEPVELQPDGGHHLSDVRRRHLRRGRGGRFHSRLEPLQLGRPRQLLGRLHPHALPRNAAAVPGHGAGVCLAGHAADLRFPGAGHHAGRRAAAVDCRRGGQLCSRSSTSAPTAAVSSA